jgi:endonuclease-3 related protein
VTRGLAIDAAGLYRRLLDAYGPQGWWPARARFEMMAGAVLVQNTAWRNVEPAIVALDNSGLLEANALATATRPRIEECIRPSGTFRVKAGRLLALATFVVEGGGLDSLARRPTESLRTDLLSVHGIGEETADAILCYAFDRARFVLDAYTRRLCSRLGLTSAESGDPVIREFFRRGLTEDHLVYGECHALIVAHAKRHCRARPVCAGCPLGNRCAFNAWDRRKRLM